jgi:hypothetical protein
MALTGLHTNWNNGSYEADRNEIIKKNILSNKKQQ